MFCSTVVCDTMHSNVKQCNPVQCSTAQYIRTAVQQKDNKHHCTVQAKSDRSFFCHITGVLVS